MLYPKLRDLLKYKHAVAALPGLNAKSSSNMVGDYASKLLGIGMEFEAVRPYIIGDDVRHIDWRVSARTNRAHIKTYHAECERNIIICIDCNEYMQFGTKRTFKYIQAAHAAALFAWQALHNKDRVGALLFGLNEGVGYYPPSRTDKISLRFMKKLCEEQVEHQYVPISSALQQLQHLVPPQSVVFVVADFNQEDFTVLRSKIIGLRQHAQIVLIPIYDQFDQQLPNVGTITCKYQQSELQINTSDVNAITRYKQNWEKYSSSLEKLARSMQIPCLWLNTADDIMHTFVRKLRKIA